MDESLSVAVDIIKKTDVLMRCLSLVSGEMMKKYVSSGLVVAVALALSLTSCRDTKMRDENEQLKVHVLQLQKDSGELGNRIDVLTKENADLKAQIERMEKKSAPNKTAKTTHRKRS
jgi:hypothetical protein